MFIQNTFCFLANLNQRTIANESQTLLHFAAKYNAVECFDLLMEYGADPDDEDGNGQTALFVAAQYGKCWRNNNTVVYSPLLLLKSQV